MTILNLKLRNGHQCTNSSAKCFGEVCKSVYLPKKYKYMPGGGDSKRSMATHICAVPLSKIVDKKKNIAQLNALYLFIFC